MKVLITGGHGTIAQTIVDTLRKQDIVVFAPPREFFDVTNESHVSFYMDAYKPDILINCAGYINPSPIKDMEVQDWKNHLNINLTGAFLCSKYALLAGCKVVINIGSTSALEGRENWGAYCASKAGLMSLTETLAREEIESYCIHPSRTATKMRERLFPKEDKSSLMEPNRIAHFVSRCISKEFPNGSHIIVKKDKYYVLPMRKAVE